MRIALCVLAVLPLATCLGSPKKNKQNDQSALDRYIEEAARQPAVPAPSSPGSLWSQGGALSSLVSDLRASQVNDAVTIVVAEKASAVASGATKTVRASSVKSTAASLAGPLKAGSRLSSLADLSTASSLDGQGTTSRDTTLMTSLAGRVTHVLPNGYLVVEGAKELQVNSERQVVTVRGVVRPADLTPDNSVRSDRLAQLEVRINGKGVVNDSVRRPMFLYRLLLGLLPF